VKAEGIAFADVLESIGRGVFLEELKDLPEDVMNRSGRFRRGIHCLGWRRTSWDPARSRCWRTPEVARSGANETPNFAPPPQFRSSAGDEPLTVRACLLHAVEHSALHLGHIQLTRSLLTRTSPARSSP
jgi:hypothetical protein